MKHTIRKQILDARHHLPPEQRRSKSAEIEARLFGLTEFREAKVLLFFASFQSEVETHHMIRRALAEGKRVVLPKVKGRELDLFEIANFDRDVIPGAWGIPEPAGGRLVALADIDLIIVPGAAFDQQGNRVGYGAGFYDKLLQGHAKPTVAIAFDLQIVHQVPADRHDVPVKKIVTESRTITASSKHQASSIK
ncbi:MAG: 5-formyltetrahydrofolate cyclo-ligase [Nitrospiraceae bacterium]|nr:5-formyltetrahydrofolate cyclo-ligase [Nitrospiraceae bacterium]